MAKLNSIELNQVYLNIFSLNSTSKVEKRKTSGIITPSAPTGYEDFYASDGLFSAVDEAFYVIK